MVTVADWEYVLGPRLSLDVSGAGVGHIVGLIGSSY